MLEGRTSGKNALKCSALRGSTHNANAMLSGISVGQAERYTVDCAASSFQVEGNSHRRCRGGGVPRVGDGPRVVPQSRTHKVGG